MRRVLLGTVTALIVARPLVADPAAGVTPWSTDTGNLVLTLLWLLTALGWAGYYAWARPVLRRAVVVDEALTLFAVLTAASVSQVVYARPAWVLVADTGAILLAFWLVRQLAWSAAENFALVNVLLASGATLAAEGLVRLALPGQVATVDPIVAHIFSMEPPRADEQAANLATLAAYLALLLPMLTAALFMIGRRRVLSLLFPGTLLGLGVAALCVFRMNALALALLFAAALGCAYQVVAATDEKRPAWGLAAVGLVILAITLQFLLPSDIPSSSQEATRSLLGDHQALGVGPGNFLRAVVKYEGPPPAPLLTGPPTGEQAVRAASGIFALICLAVALIAVLRQCSSRFHRTEEEASAPSRGGTPWESYAGGVIGLSLGFLLRPAETGAGLSLVMGLAIGRSFVWFASFALLDALPRSHRWTVGALGLSLVALAAVASLQVGTFALALLLAVAAAMALNLAQGTERTWGPGPLVVLLVPVLGLLILTVVFALKVFQPVSEAATAVRDARRNYASWSELFAPRVWDHGIDARTRLDTARKANVFLVERIIKPLTSAVDADRENAAVWAERAFWDGETARVLGEIKDLVDPVDRDPTTKIQFKYLTRAVDVDCQRAQDFDPRGPTGYFLSYELRLQFVQEPMATIKERRTQCEEALENLRRLAKVTPPGPQVPYGTADIQFRLAQAIRQQIDDLPPPGDSVLERSKFAVYCKGFEDEANQATSDGKAAAAEAKRLDDLAQGTPRALPTGQRDHLVQWLRP